MLLLLLWTAGAAAVGCGRTVKPPVPASSFEPRLVPRVHAGDSVTAGAAHACAALADGRVLCWGNNAAGQLGSGAFGGPSAPVVVEGISSATVVAAGYLHTCALLVGGSVACWGDNHEGQFGARAVTASPLPVPVPDVRHAVQVVAGWAHSCALLKDGTVRCWGNNDEGQLGSGTRELAQGPVRVRRVGGARAIAAGVAHTCAVLSDGSVACWGSDGYGQRAGTTFSLRAPEAVRIAGIASATSVTAGRNHTCALLDDGSIACWGSNVLGQLGNRTGAVSPSVPVAVEGVTDALGLAAGFFHTCALLRDRSVRCWGANAAGQLGAPSRSQTISLLPLPVSGDPRASTIAAGGFYTCAVLLDGEVACWGANDFRQLGHDPSGDGVDARADGRDAAATDDAPSSSGLSYRRRR